jgi:midasin (ATPase involved in ribosome maturation)
LVLGERSRNPEDKEFIKKTIESSLRCKINASDFYDQYFEKHELDKAFERMS